MYRSGVKLLYKLLTASAQYADKELTDMSSPLLRESAGNTRVEVSNGHSFSRRQQDNAHDRATGDPPSWLSRAHHRRG